MRFPFRFAAAYRPPALLLGITPRTAYVELTESELPEKELPGKELPEKELPEKELPGKELLVRFGLWRLRTEAANIAGVERSGGFAYLKTAGPPHLSFADHGVTFATNGDDAVCVRFHEPVRLLDPTGRITHPGATLTVAEPQAFEDALREWGSP